MRFPVLTTLAAATFLSFPASVIARPDAVPRLTVLDREVLAAPPTTCGETSEASTAT